MAVEKVRVAINGYGVIGKRVATRWPWEMARST